MGDNLCDASYSCPIIDCHDEKLPLRKLRRLRPDEADADHGALHFAENALEISVLRQNVDAHRHDALPFLAVRHERRHVRNHGIHEDGVAARVLFPFPASARRVL